MRKIKLAISTCPNDTFAFHAILNKEIDMEELEFEIELMDIRQLNDGLLAGEFDVAKASFHTALILSDQLWVLPSGSALGFGVGPLLLAASGGTSPDHPRTSRTLCPGPHTTATLLFRLFYGMAPEVDHVIFSEIMPSLQKGDADFGVCIHEGRFTWEQQGLYRVADLGERWEAETKCPLPLGGIVARKSIEIEVLTNVQRIIQRSIQFGLDNRSLTLPTMRRYAQEFDDSVLFQHVDLYVNQWTVELGPTGRNALNCLSRMAKQIGLIDTSSSPIEILPLK